MKKYLLALICGVCLTSCNQDMDYDTSDNEQIMILKQIVALQDSMIEKAKWELEYHVGDYAFCDGDEPMMIDELKSKLH